MKQANFTDIGGLKVGHAQNFDAATGCTVVICEEGAVAGVDARGGSPGTRETDALDPVNLRKSIHAVLLAGGSAFGLDAAAGVMQYLEERGVGRDVKVTRVPIVCGAILFDLKCGDYRIRPDKEMGYEACLNAGSGAFPVGSVGAGTGATIGKIRGLDHAMKGGIGSFCLRTGELMVGAVMAVNCVGDIYDAESNRLIAGVLNDDKKTVGSTEAVMIENYRNDADIFSGNTVIGVVATNAVLTKAEANKLASVSQNGIARAVRPAHTSFDGDTIFTMATGKVKADPDVVGILAARSVENAILQAVKSAEPLAGFPAYKNLF
ncbi:peptidase S58 family protein [Caproiciproducens sp. NJN-50]|uniref:P1 family peptidase n=1 Tax=Acutalibacteraceae TaxID=3082771 RepID=UPI000FFE19BA|nr:MULTISPECIES: P1 family peptidase [Acutalibacteraceae]QAT51092.1 peptidase S58 family protein [Caproiciproducens sp. NJN-50]